MTRFLASSLLTAAVVTAFAPSASAEPGQLDPTFSRDGKVTTEFGRRDGPAHTLALQADGRIVVAGEVSAGRRSTRFALARYRTNGRLDRTFGGDGRVMTNFFGFDDIVRDVVIQPDGKIVAAGSTGYRTFALARYNADGSLDTAFGGDGKVTTDVTPGLDMIFSAALQPTDGKIVVAGAAGGQVGRLFVVARYDVDGSLDTTFGGDGIVTTNITPRADHADAVAVQPDGRILVAGTANWFCCDSEFAVVRYNPDGLLDSTFGGDGRVLTDLVSGRNGHDEAGAVALAAGGKIVVAGMAGDQGSRGGGRVAVVRYESDGTRDSSFSGNGKAFANFTRGMDWADSLAIEPNGKIVTGGVANFFNSGANASRDSMFALARFEANGELDRRFARGGKAMTNFTPGRDWAAEIALQPDAKIVAAGSADSRFALARYEAD